MPLPLIPIGAAVLGGVSGGLLSSWLGGGGKKDYSVTETHAAKEHYAPITTDARSSVQNYAPTYQYQIESPQASMVSKKSLEGAASSYPSTSAERFQEGGAGISSVEGLDVTKLAIIGVAGLIVYGVVSK